MSCFPDPPCTLYLFGRRPSRRRDALHAAVRVLCTKIGMRPADLGKVTELNAAFKRLDYADVAVLVTLANSGSLRSLTQLFLNDNQIGDAGMIEFSRSIASGSLRSLTTLFLNDNQIGDAGMIEFSRSITNGSLRALTRLDLDDNQIGDAGMTDFSRAIASGSLRVLESLDLSSNQIGDVGMIEFSRSIPIGSLPACKRIVVLGNPGNAAPLKAACEERGIALLN